MAHANARKTPKQERSQATVEAILDAAARVLIEDGVERASTNRIALVAGVSVGSLYQYFPNKDAIVHALVEKHEAEMMTQLASMAVELRDAKLEDAVRAYVKAMVSVHAVDPKLHEALTRHVDVAEIITLQAEAESIVRAFLELRHKELRRGLSVDLAAFLLVTSVEAITHAAVLQRKNVLKDPAFAEEVTQLVVRYLT